jgi:hypothetical protein
MRHFSSLQLAVPTIFVLVLSAMGIGASAQEVVLPKPAPPFQGEIGRTAKDSKPDSFGGPIQTPNFQRLADSGLRYNTFHTTALCSPTRALITGRNHHSNASGVITEMATGYPGYNSLIPKSSGSVAEGLRENGYNTHGLARCTTCRTGCLARQARLIYGRVAWASNTFMDFSEATPINGIRLCMRTPGRLSPARHCHPYDRKVMQPIVHVLLRRRYPGQVSNGPRLCV